MGAKRNRSLFRGEEEPVVDKEWVDEKEAQQTPIIGVKERFSSLKENCMYIEAAKNPLRYQR